MGQIIDLLTNLFKLTKVASVTLPGLAAAGALALLFWLPPVDVIPIAEQEFLKPPPKIPYQIEQQLPCPTVPGSARANCENPKAQDLTGRPACNVKQFILSDVNDCEDCARKNAQKEKKEVATQKPEEEECPKGNNSKDEPRTILCAGGLQPNRLLPDRNGIKASNYIPTVAARQQYLLDFEKNAFAECAEVEDSWRGVEEQESTLLNADAANLDKQRADVQDAYLTYLKANNPGAPKLRAELQTILNEIEFTRERILKNSASIKERERRSAELKRDAGIITDRLADPGRLRPRKTLDDYLSGLVNHVVAFILLSLALSLVLTAINRATFDSIYEVLFTSERLEQPAQEGEQTASLSTVLRKLGWDSPVSVIGFFITLLFCLFWPCPPNHAGIKLLLALIAGVTGVSLGHWCVRWQQQKGYEKKFTAQSLGEVVRLAREKGKLKKSKRRYDWQNLGFFNKRLYMRDPRLLLSSDQLKQKSLEEQRATAERQAMRQASPSGDTPPEPVTPKTPPPQVLQPRYAIGKGIITQQEYQDLKDSYFAQSELSFGLILPIFLLVFALGKQQLQVCLPSWVFCLLLWIEIFLTFCLFWAGMERQEKFGMEFRMLILGHWDKLNEAAAQTKPAKPTTPDVNKAISDALKGMQMQVTPLVVRLQNEPATPPPAAPSPAPSTPSAPVSSAGKTPAKPGKPQGGAPATDENTTEQK